MIRETFVLFVRETKRWAGRRPVLVVSLVTPLFWVLLFGKSFNIINMVNLENLELPQEYYAIAVKIVEVIRLRIFEIFGSQDYFTYMASGMLVVITLFQGTFSGASAIFDKRLGYMTRLMAAPIRRESIYLAKVAASVFRALLLSLILLMVAYIAGFKFKEGFTVLDLAAAVTVVVLISLTFTSIFMVLGFVADSPEALFSVANLVTLPLMFTSSALFPVDQMPEWLRLIASVNPLTYASDLVRFFLIGKTVSDPWLTLAPLAAGSLITLIVGMKISVRALEA
ncbi:MAG: ABC transporter permease [Thermoprotei archaeon]|nr:ABC transporter permease [Thermoprotei archaeon]